MSQLWHALEKLVDLTTSQRSWRLLLREEFELYREWLLPTNHLAKAIPSLHQPDVLLQISEFEPGVFEGYEEATERYVTVERRELVCYEFNVKKLAMELGKLIGFETAFEKLTSPPFRFRSGYYGTGNGAGIPFYFVQTSDPRRMDWCVDACCAENQRPFVFFVTSNRVLSSRNRAALESRNCLVVPLEQAILLKQSGSWELSAWARDELLAYRDRLLPPVKAALGKFPTPPGCRWAEVEIRFLCEERVAIVVRDKRQVLTYSQLGLGDARNGLPNKQWELLKAFAREGGLLTWLSPAASRKNRKRRELLNKTLQSFFQIPGDPIELTDYGKSWQCVFRLQPRDNS